MLHWVESKVWYRRLDCTTQGDAQAKDPTSVDKSHLEDFNGDFDSFDETLMSIARTPPWLDVDGLSKESTDGVTLAIRTFILQPGSFLSIKVGMSILPLL